MSRAERRGVEVNGSIRSRAATRAAANTTSITNAGAGPGGRTTHAADEDGGRFSWLGDEDLLAVRDLTSEVEALHVRPWQGTSGCRQHVDDP